MKSFKSLFFCIILLGQWLVLQAQPAIIKGYATELKNKPLYLHNLDEIEPLQQITVDSVGNFQIVISISAPMETTLRISSLRNSFKLLLEPGKEIELMYVDSLLNFQAAPKNVAERLNNGLHYINYFYANYGNDWQNWSLQVCHRILDSLERTRQGQIELAKDSLSDFEYCILRYRNTTTAYSFLVYFGKFVRQLPMNDPFFYFLEKINLQDTLYKRTALLAIQKLEVNYLRKHKTIPSALDFIKFIADQNIERDLAHFYAATYIQSQLQSPGLWENLHPPLDVPMLDSIQAFFDATNNPYTYFYKMEAAEFYKTNRGKPAPDFTGVGLDGQLFNLSELQGKVVFVYVWSMDCVPCEQQKQKIGKVLEYFEQTSRFMGLVLNVDADQSKWASSIADEVLPTKSVHINIVDGLNKLFGKQYAIKELPRFIIIDAVGNFYHAAAPEDDLYRLINDAILKP